MTPRHPAKAFILAAGLGTRMLPLSRDLPKPLMPLWGEPLLGRILSMLRRWGVREVLVNLHHEAGQILNYCARVPHPGLRISLSFEPEILGTGGALRRAEWFLDDKPFWLINADIAAGLKPDALLRRFARGGCLSAVWLHPFRGPRTVEMRGGLVRRLASPRPGGDHTYTFCGLHLLSPRILDFLPAAGFAGIVEAYETALRKGERIAGVCIPDAYWADLGTPRQYLEAHRELAPGQQGARPIQATGFAAIAPDAEVSLGAQIVDSVVWSGARLGARARVSHAVVGRGTRVDGRASYVVMRADRGLDKLEQSAVRAYGWRPEEASILPFGPRGSARTFTRVVSGAGRSVVLMRYRTEREENALYTVHAAFLRRLGLRVPRVLLDWPDRHVALLEDLGDATLLDVVRASTSAATARLYRAVLDGILRLHEDGLRAARRRKLRLMPPFSRELYRWERDLFGEHFLRRCLRLPPRRVAALKRDLARVALRLEEAPPALVHRDLQSSNIFIRAGRPWFIDFQGMRIGAAAYDLASLLCDPYVSLSESLQRELLAHYAGHCSNPDAAAELFWPAAIERLAQALGAYGRLSALSGMESFRRHILPALFMLRRALAHVDGLPALRAFAEETTAL